MKETLHLLLQATVAWERQDQMCAWTKRSLPEREHGEPMPADPTIIISEQREVTAIPDKERPPCNPLSIKELKRHVSKHQFLGQQRRHSKGLEDRCKGHVWWSLSPWRRMQVVNRATGGTCATAASEACEPGPGDERALRHPKSRRANPAGESREMRLIHPHCIQKPKWKALGVSNR